MKSNNNITGERIYREQDEFQQQPRLFHTTVLHSSAVLAARTADYISKVHDVRPRCDGITPRCSIIVIMYYEQREAAIDVDVVKEPVVIISIR